MMSLFDIGPLVPGFSYQPDFISADEENALLEIISRISLHQMIFQGWTAKREIASFGFDYHFDTRTLTRGTPIPADFSGIIEKVAAALEIDPGGIAELLVTRYDEGTVINWHRDAPPFEVIAGISLLSPCTFRLRPYAKAQRSRRAVVSQHVAPRSLYIMSGPARSEWEHSISPVRSQRYSLTFRTLRKNVSAV